MNINSVNESDGSLRERRERAGISREKLAQLSACSGSMVQLLESGYQPKRSGVRERVERILDALEAK
ncbi:MAG: helix-turn-helix domain-containing protein [Solirubrobacteraceae bacterium]